MNKWLGKLAVGGLCLIAIAIIGFFAIAAINVDCDGYACVGYLIILGPMFLLGLALIIIAAIVAMGSHIYSLLKK
ncbi:MAG: hypothetical protein KA319_09765 [Ferruginibacter sp.]|nr:hypothetical protein [Ferruginibacter sp.]